MRSVVSICVLLTAWGGLGCTSTPAAQDSGAPDSAPTPTDSGPTMDAADMGVDAAPDTSVDTGAADTGVGVPDVGMCEEVPCRLVPPQCGCATGTVCQRPGGDTPLRTCVAPGTAAIGETCFGNTECQEAAVCIATGTSSGHCHPYCASIADCPTGLCIELIVSSEDVGACTPDCNPASGALCDGGTGCSLVGVRRIPERDIVFTAVCVDSDLPALDEPCPDFRCGPTLTCVGRTCRQVCDLAGTGCPGGLTCGGTLTTVVRGGAEYGYCR